MKNLVNFFQGARKELKKVKWPTKEQTIKYTKNVIVMSIAVALFLGTLDFIFNWLVTKVV